MKSMVQKSPFSVIRSNLEGVEDKVILFLDEIAAAFKTNPDPNQPKSSSIADTLKQEFVGKIKYIVATTEEEFNEFMKDPALLERFTRIDIKEPPDEYLKEVLKAGISKFAGGKVNINPEALDRIIGISKFLPGCNPRKAITLLNEVLATTSCLPTAYEEKIKCQEIVVHLLEGEGRAHRENGTVRSLEAKQLQPRLKEARKELEALQKMAAEKETESNFITELSNTIKDIEGKIDKVSIRLAQLPKSASKKKREALEKEYLHLDLVVLPGLKALRMEKILTFNDELKKVEKEGNVNEISLALDVSTVERWIKKPFSTTMEGHLTQFFRKHFKVSSTQIPDGLNMTSDHARDLTRNFINQFKMDDFQKGSLEISTEEVSAFIKDQMVTLKVVKDAQSDKLPDLDQMASRLIQRFPILKLADNNINEIDV